jgi:hypothetical protein
VLPLASWDGAGSALTGNVTLGFLANGTNPATMTEPTGWTEAADLGYATPTTGVHAVHRDSGFTGTTITWGSTTGGSTLDIILEMDTSAAGGGAVPGCRHGLLLGLGIGC